MKCSILINNYNYSKYVVECLQSAVRQTHSDVEIIIVDDGSTDGSQDLIATFAKTASRPIKTIFKENGGQGSALNTGYAHSSGDVVFFLDADDVLSPDCVARVVATWTDQMVRLYFNLQFIDGDSQPIESVLYHDKPMPRGDLRDQALTTGLVIDSPTSGNAWARRYLETIMPIPEQDWAFFSDVYLYSQATLAGHTGRIDEPLGSYRVHGRNGSAHTQQGRLAEQAICFDLAQRGLTDDLMKSYADSLGLNYENNAFVESYGHAQLVFIYSRFFGIDDGRPGRWSSFFRGLKKLMLEPHLALYKKPVFAAWMTLIAALPARLAERLTVLGYHKGLVITKNKYMQRGGR